ncbi:MAG: hypothetical protein P8K08_22025 [Fuerstiella sp.]|nr:hypothetical protein [Fuerstiella sp.]
MNQQKTALLTGDIEAVAQNTSRQIKTLDQRSFIRANISTALKLLIAAPLLAVTTQLLRWLFGFAAGAWLPWEAWIFLTCVIPAVWLCGEAAMRQFQVTRHRALRAADEQIGSSDRIVTADEFLRRTSRDGFMQAAVEDAVDWAAGGRDTVLDRGPAEFSVSRSSLWPVPVAITALVLAGLLTQLERATVADSPAGHTVTPVSDSTSVEQTPTPKKQLLTTNDQQPPPKQIDSSPDQHSQRAVNRQGAANAAIPDNAEESQGKVNEGETRESRQSANPSSAKGSPSASGQPSRPGDQTKTTPKKKQQVTPKNDRKKKPRKQNDKPSGATAGQGSSKGSDNNAAPSDWASTSQAATPDDKDIEDEDSVDDEEEEQESRGGVQPNMRDRRTPVNRDLQIGFGTDRPNPDANGRGGPGGQKKSRGVASLVLGVPIPDRVNGQPNKGRIRITQQRITPEAEQSDQGPAQNRSPRDGIVGPIHHPDFSPWLQDLVKRYFLDRRARFPLRTSATQSAPATNSVNTPQTINATESDAPQS